MTLSEAVDVPGSRSGQSAPAGLRGNRDFTVFTTGTALSNLARSAAFVGVTILGYQQWHDAALVGLIDTIEVVTYIIFALPAGWMADRYTRKGVRALGALLGGAAYTLLTLVDVWGRPTVGLVVAVVVVAALGLELIISSGRVALRQIVVQDDMMAAQTGNQGIGAASMMVGAVVGGALWEVRPWVPLAFVAGCCLGTAATTAVIGRKLAPEHGGGRAGAPADSGGMLSGLRFLLREPVLRAATVIGGLTEFAVGGYIISMIILMQQRGQSFAVVGGVLGACTLGMAAGAVIGGSLMSRLRLGTVTWVGLLASCVSFSLAAVVRQPAADFALLFLACLIVAPLTSGFATYEAMVAPLELQGRVTMADRSVVNAMKALAPVAGGMLLSSFGGTATLELFGVCVGVAALYAVADARIRTVDVRVTNVTKGVDAE
jgi:MFS family permease